METLCKTLYDPLIRFCGPLHTAFPALLSPGFERLSHCRERMDWQLIKELGPGCTKAMLTACLTRDEGTFFAEPANPLVSFIGGQDVYDRLLAEEREVYWGERHLATIIRQCMVLHALEPMSQKLQCIVSKLTDPTTSDGVAVASMDQASIMNKLLSDPTVLSSMLSLMDSPASMKTLMSSLQTIVGGLLTDVAGTHDDGEREEEGEGEGDGEGEGAGEDDG